MAMASSKDDTTGGGDKGAEAASTPAMPEDAGEARVDDPEKLRPEKQPETKPSIAGSNRTTEEIERRMVRTRPLRTLDFAFRSCFSLR